MNLINIRTANGSNETRKWGCIDIDHVHYVVKIIGYTPDAFARVSDIFQVTGPDIHEETWKLVKTLMERQGFNIDIEDHNTQIPTIVITIDGSTDFHSTLKICNTQIRVNGPTADVIRRTMNEFGTLCGLTGLYGNKDPDPSDGTIAAAIALIQNIHGVSISKIEFERCMMTAIEF